MTVATVTKPPAKAAGKTSPSKGSVKALQTLVVTGVSSWVSGEAASEGWHGSLPFVPTWAVLLIVALLLFHGSYLTGAAWHTAKAEATAEIASKEKFAELAAEKWIETQGAGFLEGIVSKELG